jgi:hypothetical protein
MMEYRNVVWIIIIPVTCFGLAYVISTIMWQSTVRVYRLRLPRGTSVDHIGSWVGQVAAVLRAPRWWDVFPRWPVCIELIATERGIDRLIVVPARLYSAVAASLAAALPGARLTDNPDISACGRYGWRTAGEIRLRGAHHLLDIDRGEEANRHIVAALQPLQPGEARAPRAAWLPDRKDQIVRPSWRGTHERVVRDRRPLVTVRWRQTDPVLAAVCRVGVAVADRPHARAIARRIWAALRGLDVPGARITRRWLLPPIVMAARITYRSIPIVSWPLTLTSRAPHGARCAYGGGSGAAAFTDHAR